MPDREAITPISSRDIRWELAPCEAPSAATDEISAVVDALTEGLGYRRVLSCALTLLYEQQGTIRRLENRYAHLASEYRQFREAQMAAAVRG